MYDYQVFRNGVHSVLQVHWELCCETPLAIRNGLSIAYQKPETAKGRGKNLTFKWKSKDPNRKDEHEVAALSYGYAVENSKVNAYHFVPASSVRGALRSWTINHLVHPEFRSQMNPPKNDDEDGGIVYLGKMQNALSDRHHGYQMIASLFGLAVDTRSEDESMANVGRLSLETTRFKGTGSQPIAVSGFDAPSEFAINNAHRQMIVRNPLDRITHASKDGGLHHFLEFCAGERFAVNLSILNPQESDLGLLNLWVREINDGLLRLGALTSIGRGRVSIDKQSYGFWRKRGTPKFTEFDTYFRPTEGETPDDALADWWCSYTLPAADLAHFETYLREHI